MILNEKWCYVNQQDDGGFLPVLLTPEAAMIASVITFFSNPDSDYAYESIDREIKLEYFQYPEAKFFWRTLQKLKLDDLKLELTVFFSVAREIIVEESEEESPKNLARLCANLFTEEFTCHITNVNHHVTELLKDYFRREVREAMKKNTPDAFRKGEELRAKLDELEDLDKSKLANIHSSGDIARALFDKMLDREANPDKYEVLSWGYEQHDAKIPLSKGHLVIIGGRSGSGKTTYAMNLLRKQLEAGKKCAVFSLEMSKEELAQILVAQIGRIPYEIFNSKMSDFTNEQIDIMTTTVDRLQEHKSVYVDLPAQSVESIRNMSIQIKAKIKGLDFIFIDHIHIMGDGQRRFGGVREKIMHISAGLKNLAKELEVPVIALAQMNRNVEARQDKTPTVADLKESGSLEQDADTIVFTYRGTDPNKREDPYVICRKNRHGVENDFRIYMNVNPVFKTFEENSPDF
jgi:replicative DNA helicase